MRVVFPGGGGKIWGMRRVVGHRYNFMVKGQASLSIPGGTRLHPAPPRMPHRELFVM